MSKGSAMARAVGARLRELRQDAELSQEQVAHLAGSHRPIISRVERGLHEVDLRTLRRYACALDLDIATVLAPLEIERLVGQP
jgi:transcriptional regulator with XRE-family HTH domain